MAAIKSKTTDIRIIGPRRSGKTTYLATLAHLPHRNQLEKRLPGLKVTTGSSDGENLARMAEDLLLKGEKLAGTYRENIDVLPFYYFQIKVPPTKGLPGVEIDLAARDFAGEIFQDLPLVHKENEIKPYMEDLFTATGWMVMLTHWDIDLDIYLCKPAFSKLCREISEREQTNEEIKNLRIAVVMSKCERGEIWPSRLEPDRDLFKVRLPKSYELLTTQLPGRVQFFACSSFGVLSDRKEDFDPRPNRYVPDDGSSAEYNSFLRNPSQWNPYGLISPIYWLATGKMLDDKRI